MGIESDSAPDSASLELLEDGLRKSMLSCSGAELDAALADLGWTDMLSEMPDLAIPLVFRLLGETGSHASVLNDVILETIGALPGGTPPMPYAGGGWVVWERDTTGTTNPTLGGLPLRRVPDGELMRMGEARRAVGWWLVGSARAMLALARHRRRSTTRSNTRRRGSSSASRLPRSRRSGTGWPRRWWPSKAPRRR